MLLKCAEIPQNLMMAAKGTLCRFPLAMLHKFKVYSHSCITFYFRKKYYLLIS